jgi:dienelactone hydrolase
MVGLRPDQRRRERRYSKARTIGPMRAGRPSLAALGLCAGLGAAGCVDHALIHPRAPPAGVGEWSERVLRGELQVRLEWARPSGPSAAVQRRLPTVIVHPEAGHTAREMRGVLRDLAARGYLAVAADYQRARNGRYRDTLFAWRDAEDPRVVVDRVAAHPWADPSRLGFLGFSQGGVLSLVIAAHTGLGAAIVAYYPVTDFERWLGADGRRRRERWVFRLIRHHFYRQSGARNEEEFRALLARASPLRQAERIRAPVLLVHGDRDRSASVEESRRLAARLAELGREVELLVLPGAGHVFNFRDRASASRAWAATVDWLDRYVRDRSSAQGLDATFNSAPADWPRISGK